jgi:hypothetical protein
VVKSVLSQCCGWKIRADVVRYLKFWEPYTVEPAACRHANMTGMLVINKKSFVMQVDVVRSYSDFMEGSLDLKHNCLEGTHTPWRSHLGPSGHLDGCGGVRQDGVGTGE